MIRRRIIELGICVHHQPYRRPRDGRNLFHRTPTIFTESEQRKQHYDWINSKTTTYNIEIACKPDNILPKNDTNSYNCALINYHSIVNKTADLKAKIWDNNIDICALSETWIKQDDNIMVMNMCPVGYSAISLPRPDCSGGGITIIHNKNINVSTHKSYSFASIECCNFSITISKMRPKDHFILIYRPPNLSMLAFLHDLATVTEGKHKNKWYLW